MASIICTADTPRPVELAQRVLGHGIEGRVLDAYQTDLDLDGNSELIAITYRTIRNGHPLGGKVIVMQTTQGTFYPVWSQKQLNPWKLRVADVDGDRRKEIITGVWKKSPKDPVMAKRCFVYSWTGSRMTPKWLGSRLSRRFIDFDVHDINKDGWAELLAMEVSPGKPQRIGIYRWRSFGFDWIGSAKPTKWKEITR
ncbi:MAG: FG-GAP repeat domain-containing protein [Armatimonadota bacterium]